jgi:hypothetical protein
MEEYKMPKMVTNFLFGMGSVVILYGLWLGFQVLMENASGFVSAGVDDMQMRIKVAKCISTFVGGLSVVISGTIVYLLTEIAIGVNKK